MPMLSPHTNTQRRKKVNVMVGRRTIAAAVYLLSVIYVYNLSSLQSETSSISISSIDLPFRSSHARSHSHTTAVYGGNDVLQFDHFVLENIRATYKGASSHIEYYGNVTQMTIQAIPLMASVDRRPIVVRKQLMDDSDSKLKLTHGGGLLGCAMTATTFVTNLRQIDVDHYKNNQHNNQHSCQLCFRFSSHHDMAQFLSNIAHAVPAKLININTQPKTHTKCITGATNIYAHFAKWQKEEELKGERFHGFGYPWTVDCVLPNGIKELTCREISRMQQSSYRHNGLMDVHLETWLVLRTKTNNKQHINGHKVHQATITVRSKWPWSALTSHDDDRSKIANKLSYEWNDKNSWYVPKNAQEMKLAHVEGPGYDATAKDGIVSLKTDSSRGGVHMRFLVNLYHFIRNCPGSTHIIAVVDGQARESYNYIMKVLDTKLSILYQDYWQSLLNDINQAGSTHLIPIHKNSNTTAITDSTLKDLLLLRNIKIRIVPILTPTILFEKSVCAGQYQFTTYLAARYAADYQVMMFIDGDTTFIEKSLTQQQTFYDRFFSAKKSTKCAGHRFQLIEQYVPQKDSSNRRVMECVHDLVTHSEKWKYAIANCHLKEGHIVGRTDAIYAFSVHHPTTIAEYAPRGVEDCNTGNKWSDKFYLLESEVVQIHLRDRERKPECTCFLNHPL